MSTDTMENKGVVVVQVFDKNGNLKDEELVENLITNAGDEYNAKKVAVGISPANPSAPTAASGMKLGTGTTSPGKSAAGAANLGTYISGSNQAFDTNFPTTQAVGTNVGWTVTYQCTWAAGDVTNSAITEAVICNDAATDANATVANTYARVTFTAKDKTADDSLVITWKHKFLGT